MIVSALAFGTTGVFGKAAMEAAGSALSPLRLAQFRVTGAAIVLLLLVGVRRWRRPEEERIRWNRSTVVTVIAYGLIAFVGVQAFYFVAISRMPVGLALLIEYLSPAFVAMYALFVQRRPQHRATWIGVGLALIGLIVIARPWSGFTLNGIGVTAALLAAVAASGYFLIGESIGDRVPALPLCAWASAGGAVAMAIALPWWSFPWHALSARAPMFGTTLPVWILLVIVVLIGTVLAYTTGIGALQYIPAPVAAVAATLEVVVASVTAWVLLGEHLSVTDIAGGVVLLSGAVLAERR